MSNTSTYSATPLSEEQVILLCECYVPPTHSERLQFHVTAPSEIDAFLHRRFPQADTSTIFQVRDIILVEGVRCIDGSGVPLIDVTEFLDLIVQRQQELVEARNELAEVNTRQIVSRQHATGAETPVTPPPQDEQFYIESIAANLEDEQIDMLRDAFIKLDHNGDGYIGRSELILAMRNILGPRFDTVWQYHKHIFSVADRDKDGRLSLTEFLSSFADGPGVVPREVVMECVARIRIRLTDAELEQLRQSFLEIDKDHDGFIDAAELKAGIKALLGPKQNKNISEENFDEMVSVVLAAADSDADGRLNLSEFIRSYQEDQGVLPAGFIHGRQAEKIKRNFTESEVAILKAAFSTIDANNDGFIDYQEMHLALTETIERHAMEAQKQGLPASPTWDPAAIQQLADQIMVSADRNNDGKLSLTEFIRNFKLNEEIMEAALDAADAKTAAAHERLAMFVDRGDIYRMVKLFKFLDVNHDGFLDQHELQGILDYALSEHFPAWTTEQKQLTISNLFKATDANNDGKISVQEFVASFCSGYDILPLDLVRECADRIRRILRPEELQHVVRSFRAMDIDSDGFVTPAELRAAVESALSADTNVAEIDAVVSSILQIVDTNKDGRISLKEFIASFELDQEVLPSLAQVHTNTALPPSVTNAAVGHRHQVPALPPPPVNDEAFTRRDSAEDSGELVCRIHRALTHDEVEMLKQAFKTIDTDGDSYVDYNEIYRCLSDGGVKIADVPALADKIISSSDKNKDGKISLTEFIRNVKLNTDTMAIPVLAALETNERNKANRDPELVQYERNLEMGHGQAIPANRPDSPTGGPVDRMRLTASSSCNHQRLVEADDGNAADQHIPQPLGAHVPHPPADRHVAQRIDPQHIISPQHTARIYQTAAAPYIHPSQNRQQDSHSGLTTIGEGPESRAATNKKGIVPSPIVNDVTNVCINDEQLRSEFLRFDVNGSGVVSKQEFRQKYMYEYEWCGLEPTLHQFETAWNKICANPDHVTYEEFCIFMLERAKM